MDRMGKREKETTATVITCRIHTNASKCIERGDERRREKRGRQGGLIDTTTTNHTVVYLISIRLTCITRTTTCYMLVMRTTYYMCCDCIKFDGEISS